MRDLFIIVIHQIVFQGIFLAKNVWLSRKLRVPIRGGNREARISIAFLGFFIVLSLVLAALAHPPGSIELFGATTVTIVAVLLLVSSTCVGLASLLGLRDSWRVGVPEEQKTELVEDGIYRFTRNPYFVAYLIMFAAYTVLLQSVVLLLLSFVGFVLIHTMVLKEERYLAAVHGERYREYQRRVPRYLIHSIANSSGESPSAATGRPRYSLWLLVGLSAIYFMMEWVPNALDGYGYFIDELYYIACSKRLALGYVDHPPLSMAVLAAWSGLFGVSIASIRFLPALFGAATVFTTGLIARRLGAGTFGQALAALAYMAAAVPMVMFGIYSMNALQLLIWALLLLMLVEIGKEKAGSLWPWFGLLAGLGLENKHTIVLLPIGLVVGLLLTGARRFLRDKRFWLGGLIAVLVLLPNIYWQVRNGWPSLEFYRNAALLKNLPAAPLDILTAQILYMNPVGFAVWLPGLLFLVFFSTARRWRFIGWTFLTLLALLLISGQSRPDRLTGAYPVLYAAGGLFWERMSERRRGAWARWALVLALIASGAVMAPLGIPLLSPDKATDYAARSGIVPQMERGPGKRSELPQWFADRFGWEQLTRDVATVWEAIPEEERSETIILAPSYGHAGALELFGPRYGLPPVAGVQNNYHLWGLPDGSIGTVISLGIGPEHLSWAFESVVEVAVHDCDHCMRWRDEMTIYVARGPKVDLHEVWGEFRHFE